jgi:hypothetical protein
VDSHFEFSLGLHLLIGIYNLSATLGGNNRHWNKDVNFEFGVHCFEWSCSFLDPFVQVGFAQETLPKFPKLWVDFAEEEIRS